MASERRTHLPDEIVDIIAKWLYELPRRRGDSDKHDPRSPDLQRQIDLRALSMVSRQWYRVGTKHLYHCPVLWENDSFTLFMRTVNESSSDLGSNVGILNLKKLQHQSSPSQTARLISWTKKGLKVFLAPRVSVATNSLAPLSKCKNIITLDLSLVGGRSISFSRLKKAICSLPKLSTLRLPVYIPVTDTDDSAGNWPCSLHNMQIGGFLDPTVMSRFKWPPNLFNLTIEGCSNLDLLVLESILEHEQLRDSLRSLILSTGNRYRLDGTEACVSLYSLPHLYHLELPVDLMYDLCILPSTIGPLPIRSLVLTKPHDEDSWIVGSGAADNSFLNSIFQDLSRALLEGESLCDLWTLGVDPSYPPWSLESQQDRLDTQILDHLDRFEDKELDEMSLEELGIYEVATR